MIFQLQTIHYNEGVQFHEQICKVNNQQVFLHEQRTYTMCLSFASNVSISCSIETQSP
jgi:hypothetical protein